MTPHSAALGTRSERKHCTKNCSKFHQKNNDEKTLFFFNCARCISTCFGDIKDKCEKSPTAVCQIAGIKFQNISVFKDANSGLRILYKVIFTPSGCGPYFMTISYSVYIVSTNSVEAVYDITEAKRWGTYRNPPLRLKI